MLTVYGDVPLGDLVTENPLRARIFDRCGLDYCCGGHRSLAAACRLAGANLDYICRELESLERTPGNPDEPDWSHLPLGDLVDDIVDRHHAFLRTELPRLDALCRKVVALHGATHPELHNVLNILRALTDELQQHMLKEERVLFPFVKALEAASHCRRAVPIFHCGSVSNPIRVMIGEHQQAQDALCAIRRLTNDLSAPADACASYRSLLEGLAALEQDLHLHIHKENNLLFLRAAQLEAELTAI